MSAAAIITIAMEIQRADMATLGPQLTRAWPGGGMAPMAVFDAGYRKPRDPLAYRTWLDEQAAAVIEQLRWNAQHAPDARRVIRPDALGAWEVSDDFIERNGEGRLGSIDWTRPLATQVQIEQMMHLRYALAAARIDPAELDVFVNVEVEKAKWKTSVLTDADYYRIALSPLKARSVMIWNHVAGGGDPRIPCEYWAIKFWPSVVDVTSNLEAYIGWHNPNDPRVEETAGDRNTPDGMWRSFVRFINAARSAALVHGPENVVVHLPVCHPVPSVALWYTGAVIQHCRLIGITRFGWATYMTSPGLRVAMADRIAVERKEADRLAAEPGRPKYRAVAIQPWASIVGTRGLLTKQKDAARAFTTPVAGVGAGGGGV